MKVDYISDLHLDFYIKKVGKSPKLTKTIALFIDKILPDETGEVLIIAGDIGHYNSQTKELLKEFKKLYKEVLIVHGNHDLYMISENTRKKYEWDSFGRIVELKEICKELNVHYLDGNVVEINNIKFGGTCGWYDLPTPDDISFWKGYLNDANLIQKGYPVQLAYSYGKKENFFDTQKFYRSQLEKLENIADVGCDVLITHVAQVIPPNYAMNPMFVNDPGNIFFYTDNFDLVKQSNCEYYVYGHTHDEQKFQREEVQMLCNPFGYPQESPGVYIQSFEI